MTCHVCGGSMQAVITDLPFKVGDSAILVVRRVPAWACGQCGTHLLEDGVMERIDALMADAQQGDELRVVSFAA